MAGGFSVAQSHFEDLHQALLKDIDGRDFNAEKVVIPVSFEELTIDNVSSLEALEPYGQTNEQPLFILKDVTFDGLRQLSEGKHLRFDKTLEAGRFAALYFSKGDRYEDYRDQTLTLVGTLSINEYHGFKSVNMIIEEIVNDDDLEFA